MEVRKTWKNWYRYVAGVTGGGIGAIAGLAIAAWGVYCLGFDAGGNCECNYLSQLMHKHMGDEMYKEVATSMNDKINQNFEKMNRK